MPASSFTPSAGFVIPPLRRICNPAFTHSISLHFISSSSNSIMDCLISSLFNLLFAMESKMAGKRTRLVMSDMSSVSEMSIPNAAVPPKLEAEKMENPKNKITEV